MHKIFTASPRGCSPPCHRQNSSPRHLASPLGLPLEQALAFGTLTNSAPPGERARAEPGNEARSSLAFPVAPGEVHQFLTSIQKTKGKHIFGSQAFHSLCFGGPAAAGRGGTGCRSTDGPAASRNSIQSGLGSPPLQGQVLRDCGCEVEPPLCLGAAGPAQDHGSSAHLPAELPHQVTPRHRRKTHWSHKQQRFCQGGGKKK